MAPNTSSNRGRGARSRTSPDDPYCEFKDDRKCRSALVSRDLHVVGCRLVTAVGARRVRLSGFAVGQCLQRVEARRPVRQLECPLLVGWCPSSQYA